MEALKFFLFFGLLALLGLVLLLINKFFAPKKFVKEKFIGYECGLDPSGDTYLPFKIKYYLIAIVFLIFDIEIVFLYPWAIVLDEFLIFGLIEVIIFIGLLLIAYFYIWKEGGFDWGK